jgi:hypothetical protein
MSDQRSEVLIFGPLARLRVHRAIIRKALGERQFGSRYISNIEGGGLLVCRFCRLYRIVPRLSFTAW